MNKQEESDRYLATDWRIHFPAAMAKSPDLQTQMIATLRQCLPPETQVLLPDLIALGLNPVAADSSTPALWLTYGQEPALLAHEHFANYRALTMRIWWQLTGMTELVLWGDDGKWFATFDPAPNGRYVLFVLGGA